MKKKLLFVMTFISLTFLAFAGKPRPVSASEQISIVTSFYPIYEFTKGVAGDEAKVSLLIKAGTEVHDFEPSTKDIAKIADADAFVYDDDNMETWISSVKKSVGKSKVKFVKSTGDMILLPGTEEEGHDHEGEDHHHQYDPHVWLAPSLAIKQVENIRDSLSKSFPTKAEAFKANVKTPPMGHFGNNELEIGRVCVQLANPDFKYMTGETLTLEGGLGLRP